MFWLDFRSGIGSGLQLGLRLEYGSEMNWEGGYWGGG